MKTWKNRAQKLLIIHNWIFLGSFFRSAHMAENWFPILEIRLRHPLFFLLCDCTPPKENWQLVLPQQRLLMKNLFEWHRTENDVIAMAFKIISCYLVTLLCISTLNRSSQCCNPTRLLPWSISFRFCTQQNIVVLLYFSSSFCGIRPLELSLKRNAL